MLLDSSRFQIFYLNDLTTALDLLSRNFAELFIGYCLHHWGLPKWVLYEIDLYIFKKWKQNLRW